MTEKKLKLLAVKIPFETHRDLKLMSFEIGTTMMEIVAGLIQKELIRYKAEKKKGNI